MTEELLPKNKFWRTVIAIILGTLILSFCIRLKNVSEESSVKLVGSTVKESK